MALSSGEAELNSAMKGISEATGLPELLREILQVTVTIRMQRDAAPSRCWQGEAFDDQSALGPGSGAGLRHGGLEVTQPLVKRWPQDWT